MATPFGIAYGIGAGLAGVPQAYMQGIGADQQLQQREMMMAQQQKAIADQESINRIASQAISEGGDNVYGKLMERLSSAGHGSEAVKLIEPYAKQKAMQSQMLKQETVSRIGMGDKAGAIGLLKRQGLDITDYTVSPDGNTITLHTPTGSQNMRLDDALGLYMGGQLGARLIQTGSREQMFQAGLGQKQEQFERTQGFKEADAEEKNKIAWARVAKMGAGGGAGKTPAAVQTAQATARAVASLPNDRRPPHFSGMSEAEIYASMLDRLAKGGIGPEHELKNEMAKKNFLLKAIGVEAGVAGVKTQDKIDKMPEGPAKDNAQKIRNLLNSLVPSGSGKPSSQSPNHAPKSYVGMATSKPDGVYTKDGIRLTVKGGKVISQE